MKPRIECEPKKRTQVLGKDRAPARDLERKDDAKRRPPSRAKPARGKRPADRAIIVALEAAAGRVEDAAERLGISSSTLRRRLREDAQLAAAHLEIDERWLDLADSQLKSALTAGEPWAIRFYLTYKGKKRDHDERMEVTGKDGAEAATNSADPLAGLDTTKWSVADFETYRALVAKAMGQGAEG